LPGYLQRSRACHTVDLHLRHLRRHRNVTNWNVSLHQTRHCTKLVAYAQRQQAPIGQRLLAQIDAQRCTRAHAGCHDNRAVTLGGERDAALRRHRKCHAGRGALQRVHRSRTAAKRLLRRRIEVARVARNDNRTGQRRGHARRGYPARTRRRRSAPAGLQIARAAPLSMARRQLMHRLAEPVHRLPPCAQH
jgi:hypothetical protein